MELFLFAYPGITADDLNTTIISEFLPPPSRIGTVVLHAGCNNASTRNLTQPIDEAAQAGDRIFRKVRPGTRVGSYSTFRPAENHNCLCNLLFKLMILL